MEKIFETFEHGADIGIRGYGKTLEEAFSNSLKALVTLLTENINFSELTPAHSFNITLSAEELDELFVTFINKTLSTSYIEEVLFFEFKGSIEQIPQKKEYNLNGKIMGEKFDIEKFGYGVEVKGATFTMAKVEKRKDVWIAQCVVDV
jgi:SHS2 domain-containing protein